MAKIVQLSNIEKSYDETKVLTGVDLDIEEGDLIVLLGPSGSRATPSAPRTADGNRPRAHQQTGINRRG